MRRLLGTAGLAIGATTLLISSAGLGAAGATARHAVAPRTGLRISSLTANPIGVGVSGGKVRITVKTTDAVSCRFNVVPKLAPLPEVVSCSSGTAWVGVTIPKLTGSSNLSWTFTVRAENGKLSTSKALKFTQSASTPPG